MEKRKANLIIGLSGNKRGIVTKLSLPTLWVKKWGISENLEENDREVYIYNVADEVIISRKEKSFEEIMEFAKREIEYEITKNNFIISKIVDGEEDTEDFLGVLTTEILESSNISQEEIKEKGLFLEIKEELMKYCAGQYFSKMNGDYENCEIIYFKEEAGNNESN